MRFLPLLSILGVMACASNGTPSNSGNGTTAGPSGSATVGTSGDTGRAITGTGSAGAGTGTAAGTGSGGTGASSGGGPSPIGLWFGGSAAVNATELMLGGPSKLSDKCPPPDSNASPAGASAFDGNGDLWVQYPGDINVYMWTPSQLAQECVSGVATITLTPGAAGVANQGFSAIAFDSQGNLWCVNPDTSLIGFQASDLAASGSIKPAWGLQAGGSATNSLLQPLSLAFDHAGYLWVANAYSVLAFAPSTLAAAVTVDGALSPGSVVADLQLTNANDISDLQGAQAASFAYRYVAFDSVGNLWVTIEDTETGGVNEIAEYSAAQLAALHGNDEPSPTSVVTLKVANSVVWGPLAFDSDGTLWAGIENGQPNLYRFSKTDLTPGSNPDLALTIPGGTGVSMAFDPIPHGLPIQP